MPSKYSSCYYGSFLSFQSSECLPLHINIIEEYSWLLRDAHGFLSDIPSTLLPVSVTCHSCGSLFFPCQHVVVVAAELYHQPTLAHSPQTSLQST